jgi:hypothetical protein
LTFKIIGRPGAGATQESFCAQLTQEQLNYAASGVEDVKLQTL